MQYKQSTVFMTCLLLTVSSLPITFSVKLQKSKDSGLKLKFQIKIVLLIHTEVT